jgi:hypothetical protein
MLIAFVMGMMFIGLFGCMIINSYCDEQEVNDEMMAWARHVEQIERIQNYNYRIMQKVWQRNNTPFNEEIWFFENIFCYDIVTEMGKDQVVNTFIAKSWIEEWLRGWDSARHYNEVIGAY